MNLEIHPIFVEIISTCVLTQHSDKNDYFYKKVLELKKNSSNIISQNWRCDTFSTERIYDLSSDNTFRNILPDIKLLVTAFASEHGVDNCEPILKGAWINLAPPGEYQEYHIHTNSHISVVYYIKTPKNCGDLVFRSHGADKDMCEMPSSRLTIANSQTYQVSPEESKIVIFKSNLSHMVEKNKSTEDRVSIALNFYLEK